MRRQARVAPKVSEILPAKEADKGAPRILQPFHDVFAILDPSFAEPGDTGRRRDRSTPTGFVNMRRAEKFLNVCIHQVKPHISVKLLASLI
jgi:hypothetical protein